MNKRLAFKSALAITGILILIFDSKTAVAAAHEAVQVCLYTVLPSLFPFITLSVLLNNYLLGRKISILRPLCRLCGIPKGGESLLVLGLIGGYPIGAQAAADARRNGSISENTYKRLLGFCNNAGPSFIFGLVAAQFTRPVLAWIIWCVHMISAIITGIILPQANADTCRIIPKNEVTLAQAMTVAIKVISKICGWVILFRVLIAYISGLIPERYAAQNLFGFLELTNGCINLSKISSEGHRFITAICFLNFGGLCVGMQTISVCEGLGTGMYFPGKLIQTVIGLIISVMLLPLLFATQLHANNILLIIVAAAIFDFVIWLIKKWWQFRQKSYIMDAVH